MMTCSIPLAIASSTPYWMVGLSTSGSISFGCALVTGRKRVPRPAADSAGAHDRRDHPPDRGQGQQAALRGRMSRRRKAPRLRHPQAGDRPRNLLSRLSDELDRVAPRESARNKARDKKVRGPKV